MFHEMSNPKRLWVLLLPIFVACLTKLKNYIYSLKLLTEFSTYSWLTFVFLKLRSVSVGSLVLQSNFFECFRQTWEWFLAHSCYVFFLNSLKVFQSSLFAHLSVTSKEKKIWNKELDLLWNDQLYTGTSVILIFFNATRSTWEFGSSF